MTVNIPQFDIGNNHTIEWLTRKGQRVGAIINHLNAAGEHCEGMVQWEQFDPSNPHDTWELQGKADEHITLHPSVLCRICGDHGFVRDGRWVVA